MDWQKEYKRFIDKYKNIDNKEMQYAILSLDYSDNYCISFPKSMELLKNNKKITKVFSPQVEASIIEVFINEKRSFLPDVLKTWIEFLSRDMLELNEKIEMPSVSYAETKQFFENAVYNVKM